jgi:crotonobetainyl-CoA:carnitine CoA-transferase CaiB-like acyl-CoA transferase
MWVFMTVNGPIEIAGQQKIRPRRARRIGEHSDQVLPEAGSGARAIVALRQAGAVT